MTATVRTACTICLLRPAASPATRSAAGMTSDMKYCVPCFDEAGWENTHNDGNHEGIAEKVAAKKRLTPNQKAEQATMADCWICHEELNEAKKGYTPRQGTSRAGMTINVSIRAGGETKAAETEAQMETRQPGAFQVKVTTNKKTGDVAMTAKGGNQSFILFWDARGRFTGGSVTENGKARKIRNVAEALRLAS